MDESQAEILKTNEVTECDPTQKLANALEQLSDEALKQRIGSYKQLISEERKSGKSMRDTVSKNANWYSNGTPPTLNEVACTMQEYVETYAQRLQTNNPNMSLSGARQAACEEFGLKYVPPKQRETLDRSQFGKPVIGVNQPTPTKLPTK